MKITIIQGAFLPVPPQLGGAIEKAWYSLGKEFCKQGHIVTHISRTFDGFPDTEQLDGVYHKRVAGYSAPSNPLHYKLLDLLYSIRAVNAVKPCDIIITHTFWSPILLKLKKKGALYVHVGRFPKGQMKFYSNANRLQAPSQFIEKAIQAEVPDLKNKTSTVPYPITLPRYVKEWEKRENTLLYCGRIHKEKGIHLLIEAFRRLDKDSRKNWKLKIVGGWKTEHGGSGDSCLQKLKELSGDSPTSFENPEYDIRKLNNIYQSAKIFVYPSLAEKGETFGLAPLEAMSNGCIPVVSFLACFEDFIQDRQNGFRFNHNDSEVIDSLAKTLKILIAESDSELEKIQEAAIETSKSFALNLVADRFLSDFNTALKR